MIELLKNKNIRITPVRKAVLKTFLESNYAISHADIEKKLNGQFDRVTIYRTIATFMEKGLIHKVLDDKEATKYALCPEECSDNHHQHHHLHFKCRKCGVSQCLENTHFETLQLPAGYEIQEINILIEGICSRCSDS